MGRIGDPRTWLIAAVAVATCAIAVAGCGGGGGDEESAAPSTGVQLQTPTAPNAPDSGRFRPDDGPTASTPEAPADRPPGAAEAQRVLAPFRDCVSSHGVDPALLGPGGWRQPQQQGPDPAEMRKAIQAGISCIPELPPRLRAAAERLKRRYEQRQGSSG